jgi:hypothetical protein
MGAGFVPLRKTHWRLDLITVQILGLLLPNLAFLVTYGWTWPSRAALVRICDLSGLRRRRIHGNTYL